MRMLRDAGFNAIRFPMHYNTFTLPIEDEKPGSDTWIEEGFTLLDTVLSWADTYEMYVIFDLHAAPGGQGYDANINDYDPNKPSLWESTENRRKTKALWIEFAKRYKDNEWVGGFEFINETNWTFENKGNINGCEDTESTPLKEYMEELITDVRKHDPNHMFITNGNCWGHNYNGFFPLDVADDNVIIGFHKYWDESDKASIQKYLDLRETYQRPLWMSEAGSNTVEWYYDVVELLENENIGWSWWSTKRVDDGVGPKMRSMHNIAEPDNYCIT